MKQLGFAALIIIIAAALTAPVMAEETQGQKPEKHQKKGEKGDFFKKADTNADGKLSAEEFKAACTKGDAEKRFAEADTDKDGFLTPEEMKAAHEKHVKEGKGKKEEAAK